MYYNQTTEFKLDVKFHSTRPVTLVSQLFTSELSFTALH